jgi:N-acetyl-anhydromuramyl-L-alanine amidase AmpD
MNIIQKPINRLNYSTTKTQKVGFVLHWIVGEIETAYATFRNPLRRASAHFGIGSNGQIDQYVPIEQVAYHAGNWEANKKYIGIEHAGGQLINGVRKKPTHECHLASIQLIIKLCRDLGIAKLERGKNIFKHSEIVPTQCCGSLDIDYIANEVNKILNPVDEWNSKFPRETEEKWNYINQCNEDYKRLYKDRNIKEALDKLTERDQEIKYWKIKDGI